MARKRGTNERQRYKWIGHIQHYFNDPEKIECMAWIEARKPNALEAIDTISQKRIGIKFVYSENQDGYHISLQPKDAHSIYYGYTIGISHANLERGIHVALYLVSELMEQEAIPLPDKQALPDW